LAKRIFELAKELDVASKAILEKCRAEGIPNMNNHMSSISAGLEATIREWFDASAAQEGGTAVETAEKVDLEKVKKVARRKARPSKAAGGDDDEGSSGEGVTTATEEPPAPTTTRSAPAAPSAKPASAPAAGAPAAPSAPSRPTKPVGDEAPAADDAPEPRRVAAHKTEAPAPAPAPTAETADPDAPDADAVVVDDDGSPVMNVPSRPKVVKPAGPRLEVVRPTKLSGPKVVRVEAPEVIEPPRPRRPAAPGGPMSPAARGGSGARAPGTVEDDTARSPRRNKRRAGPGGPGAAPATPARRGGGGVKPGEGADRGFNWRKQDLVEREERLSRAGGLLRQRRRDIKQKERGGERAQSPAEAGGPVKIAAPFSIKDLSAATGVKASEIVKRLFMQGVMATVNSGIDAEKGQEIMLELGIELEVVEHVTAEQRVTEQYAERDMVDERPRSPVVTILGHVDHGKTSLLDRIRNTDVASGEAGGITQATSAFKVPIEVAGEQKSVTFFDTPGHEAFTEMRARGANVTDIVVLVIAADDGVMPQTIESINHAKAAGVPIVVALNKIDKPEATDSNVQKVLGQLAEHGLNPAEWGGSTEVVRTSAISGTGITELLETLDYQAQLLELKADFGGPARGVVVESKMEEGRGATASVLIHDGELKVGDFIVMGRAFGRVRDIVDDRGTRVKSSSPASPVRLSGIDELPDAGDKFYVVDSLKKAQEAAEQRRESDRDRDLAQPKVTLESILSQLKEGEVKELLVVVKADVQGSVDVLRKAIEEITTDEVKVRVLHAAVGGINESDVLLAEASRAVIIGFNVIASNKARQLAERKSVEIRNYQVIYDIVDDVKKAAEGLLEPDLREDVLGHAEVRKVFKVSRVGAIAGCYVTDGTVERNAMVRVTRGGIVVEHDRVLEQLKRFKDDAKEVRAGQECGMKIVGYDDIKEGDVIECYRKVEVKRTL